MTPGPVWTKVTAHLEDEPLDWSVWAEAFERHGLPGTVQTDDPPTMSAYLPPGSEAGLVPLAAFLTARGARQVTTEQVPEEDWAESWKQFFKPRRIGGFLVRPTWEECDLSPGLIEIVLDPGQAFGTGDHPTTRMCLVLLEERGAAGLDVADIGCGSGILSVAACRLGARSVVGVDSDGPSVEAALANARRNEVAFDVHEGKGFEPFANQTFDLVLSNIISAALIALAPEAARRVRPGGAWIVSGIIQENWGDVLKAAERCGFQLQRKETEGEWVAAILVR